MQSLTFLLTFIAVYISQTSAQTITDVAVDSTTDPNLSILVEALVKAELNTVLADEDAEYTVFAPTDAAFGALLTELDVTKEQLLDREDLADILLYHVVSGKVMADAVVAFDGQNVETAQGQFVGVGVSGQDVTLTDATGRDAGVTATDVAASNGVIHIIDQVLLPQSKSILEVAEGNEDFDILVAALKATGLNDTMDDLTKEFTVFAPTDAAFAVLVDDLDTTDEGLLANPNLMNIVLYHVLDSIVRSEVVVTLDGQWVPTMRGQEVMVSVSDAGAVTLTTATDGMAMVTTTDVQCANGVIHIIDTVLMPQEKSIADLAGELDGFETLAAALAATGLSNTLGDLDADPLTVLAPTDAAFTAAISELGFSDATELLGLEPATLQGMLMYHVIGLRLRSSDVVAADGTLVPTLQGQDIAINVDNATVMLTDAKMRDVTVTGTDIQASNGIIHVIDRVLFVQDQSIADLAKATDDLSTLVTALEKAELDTVLDNDDADPKMTVLAPTNAAFEALLEELDLTVEQLLDLPNLADILKYHVIPARLTSTQVVAAAGTSAPTLAGNNTVAISLDSGKVMLTDVQGRMSTVTATDIQATNGIVHLINEVILPELPTMEPTASPVAGAATPTTSPVDGDSSASALCKSLALFISALFVLHL